MLDITTNDVNDHARCQLEIMANNRQIFEGELYIGQINHQSLVHTLYHAIQLPHIKSAYFVNCRTIDSSGLRHVSKDATADDSVHYICS
jgi:hypothetical protein